MMETEKLCPECARPIMGRADKRFCSDMCRNAYNNKQNGSVNNLVRKINGILKKNRRVLEEFTPTGKATKVSRKRLMDNGYNFEYHTNIHITKEGSTYYFCYEYGFLPLGDDLCLLVRRDP